MSMGAGASRLVEPVTHSREGGIHGYPEVATTHLGTVTLKDSVECLPTHNETLGPNQGRVGRAKITKLASECASKISLANDSEQQTAFRGYRKPLQGAWAPKLYLASRTGAYRHHLVIYSHSIYMYASQSVPANCQVCKPVSCIRRLPESIA